jgi:hypothetical protein
LGAREDWRKKTAKAPIMSLFSLAICKAGIAILTFYQAMARRSALLYGAYGLVIALWLTLCERT